MEECCRLGLAKSIGVSNFSCKKLSQLLANATIPPAVNQVEMNPAWQQQNERVLQRERDPCECMVSFGSKWSSMAFPCSHGESNSQRYRPG
ncbi:hypothetical protein HHK36_030194 [Tetracentron sinense]|uniref:NADP-dependent oxidoreductase domain-containing protein n=1 Tax=Tetracentron sinense TaxID=13715 RepID=A0A834YER1_TETSI|nr:hypothetical protein HHK36_030194 [Tetracentron sinense]